MLSESPLGKRGGKKRIIELGCESQGYTHSQRMKVVFMKSEGRKGKSASPSNGGEISVQGENKRLWEQKQDESLSF
jgi:hypothetical protein